MQQHSSAAVLLSSGGIDFKKGPDIRTESNGVEDVRTENSSQQLTNVSSLGQPHLELPQDQNKSSYSPAVLAPIDNSLSMIKEIVGVFGTLMAILMYGSSLPVLRDIRRRQSVAEYSFVPYFGQWLSTGAQVCYSCFVGLDTMLVNFVANGLGLMLASCSLAVYGVYASDRRSTFLLAIAAGILTSTGVLIMVPVTHMDCSTVPSPRCWWSVVALGTNIAMYAGPCLIFAQVWRSKSTEFMPLSVAVGQLLCSSPWLLYGVCLGDPTVYAPNIIGVAFAFLQFMLYTYVSWQYPQTADSQRRASLIGTMVPPSEDAEEEIEPFVQQCASYGHIMSISRTRSAKPRLQK